MTVAKFLRWSGITFAINFLLELVIPFPISILALAIVQGLVGLYTERHNLSAALKAGSKKLLFIKGFIEHLGFTFVAGVLVVFGEVAGNFLHDQTFYHDVWFLTAITFAILPNLRFIRADIISSKKAVCLAFIFPGIGHFYIGRSIRGTVLVIIGIIFFFIYLSGADIPPSGAALLGGILLVYAGIWIWQIFDVRSKSKQYTGMFGSMSSSSAFGDNSLKYYCMGCGTKHKELACPKCGNKMKRVSS